MGDSRIEENSKAISFNEYSNGYLERKYMERKRTTP